MNYETSAPRGASSVSIADYPNIGSDSTRLVVFFSRNGHSRKLAYEEANRTGAAVYEIKSTERTEGKAGFWWCGRYGIHRWPMPIEPLDIDLSSYSHVTICTPVWAFSVAAPVRSFCIEAAGKIKEVDYILVHDLNRVFENVAEQMDELLRIHHTALKSICSGMGGVGGIATRV